MDRAVVTDLSRSVVAQLAPDELAVFTPTAEAYFDDPRRARRPAPANGGSLSADLGISLVLLTPIVLFVVTAILNYVSERTLTALEGKGRRWLERRRSGKSNAAGSNPSAAVPPTLGEITEAMKAGGTSVSEFVHRLLLDEGWPPEGARKTADRIAEAFTSVLGGSSQ
jgi:hypothetical protein